MDRERIWKGGLSLCIPLGLKKICLLILSVYVFVLWLTLSFQTWQDACEWSMSIDKIIIIKDVKKIMVRFHFRLISNVIEQTDLIVVNINVCHWDYPIREQMLFWWKRKKIDNKDMKYQSQYKVKTIITRNFILLFHTSDIFNIDSLFIASLY
jgi:hypothetical protein